MLNSITRYSSQVTILLLIAGVELEVAQVTNSVLFLREPFETDVESAELIIRVDGTENRNPIVVPQGIRRDSRLVSYF